MKRFINICIKPALLVPAVFLLSALGGNAEAQEYTCNFADAPFNSTTNPPSGQVSATYGARTFVIQGQEWFACACNKQNASAQLNLGRNSGQKNKYPPSQKFIDAGLEAKGATLEMNWDMERVETVTFTFGTAKNVGGRRLRAYGSKATLSAGPTLLNRPTPSTLRPQHSMLRTLLSKLTSSLQPHPT